MKHSPRILVFFCALFAFSAAAAHAVSITYIYTGTGFETGTNFTYVSPNGFLSFDTGKLVPTTATHIYFKGFDWGQITSVDFVNAGLYYLYTPITKDPHQGFSLDTFGTQHSNFADFSILQTSSVPEPSSLLLLATATLGLAAPLRRRFLRARPSL